MISAAIVGTGFAGHLHAESLLATGRAEIIAAVSRREASRVAFTDRWGGRSYDDVAQMLEAERPQVVVVALPNRFHAEVAISAAEHGAHVICEKPIAMSLQEADAMIAACRQAGVQLLYGEELLFAPKYRKVKQLIDGGSLGSIFSISHHERHDGPHSSWFFEPTSAGGGALLDMACHGVELCRWLKGRLPVTAVFASVGTFRHTGSLVDDHAVVNLRFADGAIATVQGSWAAPGGIDERLEVIGSDGSVVADLARGSAMLVHSESGVGYAAEKAAAGPGWAHVAYEEAWHWGWPQQLAHFVDCIEGRVAPDVTGEDGRATLEIVHAAYESARRGAEVQLPFESTAARPIDLYRAGDPGAR